MNLKYSMGQQIVTLAIPSAMRAACNHPILLQVPSSSNGHLPSDTFLLGPPVGPVHRQQTVASAQKAVSHFYLLCLGRQALHLSLEPVYPILNCFQH